VRDLKRPQSSIGRWLYRSGQFFAALLGRVSDEQMNEARDVLGPSLYGLFEGMPAQYRHHMLTVYRRLLQAGCDDRAVLQAALLHDAGKHDPTGGRYVSLPYRVAIVLLKATGPGKTLLGRLAQAPSGGHNVRRMGWRYPFYLSKHHAQLGAECAAQYGASPEVVQLIAHHHSHDHHDERLTALQAADERS
jgi:putative nucleotidyltransferase with HDIG domain